MKVIHIMDNLGTAGGVNSFVFDLCIAMKKLGTDVYLIGILKKDESDEVKQLRKSGVEVYCLNSASKKEAILNDIPRLSKVIQNIVGNEMAVCNLHLKLSVLMGGLATRNNCNVKCVETYHSLYSNYWLENKIMSPYIKRYIACSKTAEDEMRKRFHIKEQKICCISNGVNLEELRNNIENNEIKEYKISIVSVGRFTEQKNLHVTAEAFSDLGETYTYDIYGEGPLKEQCIKATKGSNKVCFKGNVSRNEIMKALNDASIVVMPSLWEGLSIFMLEAMAFNNPMMISDVPSLRNVFHEKGLEKNETWRCCEWGYLVETNNVEAYREAMLHFMDNRKLWKDMEKTVHNYSQEYDISIVAKKYLKEYETLY